MKASLLLGGEDTGRLDNVVGSRLAPGDGSGVLLVVDIDGVSVNDEFTVLGLDRSLESTVGRVVLEHVDHVFEVDEGVAVQSRGKCELTDSLVSLFRLRNSLDGDNLGISVLDGVTENDTTDTA